MKRLFFFMTLAAAVTTACKKEDAVEESGDKSLKPVTLTVSIDNAADTRTTGINGDDTDESKVNNLQVFVFNGEIVDGYGAADDALSVNLGCTVGERSVYALVNAPDLKSVTSKSELLGKISTLGNDVTDMEMIGSKVIQIKTDTKTVDIDVNRFASRILVKKVTNALTSPALKLQEFELKSIYVTNVAADIDYGMSGSHQVGTWYNMMSYQNENNLGSITYDAVNTKLDAGKSHDTEHYFYAYPNSASHSAALSWSPRSTMLVLKIQIGTTLYDYPILLPALESNMSYEIEEVRITRPGNLDDGSEGGTDEQEPVQGTDCDYMITVNPWTQVTVTEGTTI